MKSRAAITKRLIKHLRHSPVILWINQLQARQNNVVIKSVKYAPTTVLYPIVQPVCNISLRISVILNSKNLSTISRHPSRKCRFLGEKRVGARSVIQLRFARDEVLQPKT